MFVVLDQDSFVQRVCSCSRIRSRSRSRLLSTPSHRRRLARVSPPPGGKRGSDTKATAAQICEKVKVQLTVRIVAGPTGQPNLLGMDTNCIEQSETTILLKGARGEKGSVKR